MSEAVKCPTCGSDYPYQDGLLWICPECAHEWAIASEAKPVAEDNSIRDANHNILATGDTVTLIKDLKVKGSASTVKAGTKVKNIRLLEDAAGGHDIACKIDGIGALYLKSEFVRKA